MLLVLCILPQLSTTELNFKNFEILFWTSKIQFLVAFLVERLLYSMRLILQQIQNVSSSHLFQTMAWLLFIPVSNVINPSSTFSHNHEYPLLNYLVLNGSDNSFITFLFISGPTLSLVERSRMDLVFINLTLKYSTQKLMPTEKLYHGAT